ncbi:VWA domain-containing protein [Solimonas sp. K1W22B-7]|uniref:vWA domain-containing protein n=1 Tax=Solimonas sp. K1W22B-7 TaxID=2303331 RepID=UPI000E32DFFD|nr:VWA domain-containing protein [Solimonas sp. K1W22B-7]AXQ29930.1 VWA domain-containing protein [Solimonas sp. K1W22B-7]
MKGRGIWILVLVVVALLIARGLGNRPSGEEASEPGSSARADDPNALRILAGSELKDLEFLLPEMEKAAGAPIRFEYGGTLDAVDKLNAASAPYAFAWTSSGRYLSLATQGRIKASEKIMLSPVILGVKAGKARELGWDRKDPTWGEIADAVKAGRFSYAMTNPTASNSGFSAVVGVAAALSGKADGLTLADINAPRLREFFSGQKLTAGSSGWLADAWRKNAQGLDGMVNYESVILSMNQQGGLSEPLVPVYPKEGIITSDYPLMLLDEKRKPAYEALVAFLRQPQVQQRIMERTHRRPAAPGVPLAGEFGQRLLVELPFPGSLDVLDGLLDAYLDELRRPGHSYFVLDVSGSMEEDGRILQLRDGLLGLGGDSASLSSRFSRLQLRERVDLIAFSDRIVATAALDFSDAAAFAAEKQRYREFVGSLQADGGTAIYDALDEAYRRAGKALPGEQDRYFSIVLMTDGKNTSGMGFDGFRQRYGQYGDAARIRVFPILFGESNNDEMKALAELTGGRVFDGRKTSLVQVFRDIRGYQ